MRVLVYHNPGAGHETVSRGALADELQRAGHEAVWLGDRRRPIGDALDGIGAVVVVGGDGSVGKVARQLIGRGVPLAILPGGTANNIARHLGYTGEGVGALLSAGRRQPFDVGLLSGIGEPRYFLEGVGAGPFATTAAILEQHEARPDTVNGRADELKRDLSALRESVLSALPFACRLRIDGTEIEGRFLMVEVLNIPAVGPNLVLAPEADHADGALDVLLVDVAERDELQRFVQARLRGPAAPEFTVRRGRRVRLTVPAAQRLHVDDEIVDLDAGATLEIEVRRGGLTFILPPGG